MISEHLCESKSNIVFYLIMNIFMRYIALQNQVIYALPTLLETCSMCIITSALPQQGAGHAEHYHFKNVCFNEDVNFSQYFGGKLFC